VFNAGTTPDWIQTIRDITPQIARAQERAIFCRFIKHGTVQSFNRETFNRETGGGEVRLFFFSAKKSASELNPQHFAG